VRTDERPSFQSILEEKQHATSTLLQTKLQGSPPWRRHPGLGHNTTRDPTYLPKIRENNEVQKPSETLVEEKLLRCWKEAWGSHPACTRLCRIRK